MSKEDLTYVLLVDDDEEDQMITRDLLSEIPYRRYELDWVDNPKDARDVIMREDHDLVLVDYQLGDETGLDLIEEMKKKECELPCILLTGQGDIEVDKRAMEIGATDYLVKSELTPPLLERSIRYSINHNNALKRIKDLNTQLEERVEQRTKELSETVKKLERTNADLENEIEERKLTEMALKESQDLYTAIAENFPNGTIQVHDQDLRYIFIEGRELKKLGYRQEELLGKTVFDILPQEQATHFEEQSRPVFHGETNSFEIFYNNDHYLLFATPLPSPEEEDDAPTKILIVAENITERKEAEINMVNALEREKELNELKSRFVSTASHEFRTPLSTILSSTTLISKYNQEDQEEKRMKHIDRIRRSVQNLTDILDDLLSISKLEEGKVQPKPEEIDLPAFIEEIRSNLDQVELEGHPIKYTHEGGDERIVIDKKMLRNICTNLLSNAIKYSPREKEVRIRTRTDDHNLHLEVEDQGIGIPEEDRKELFSRFFRASNAGNIQGTGLGLNIVSKYLELMKGKVDMRSKENEGTTFFVDIPVR